MRLPGEQNSVASLAERAIASRADHDKARRVTLAQRDIAPMREKMRQADRSAADRAQARSEAMQQRATVMAAASKALGSLYAVLTPEQKAVADQNLGHGGPYAMRFGRRAG